jgi:tRNA pseudouridine38-40 synthase
VSGRGARRRLAFLIEYDGAGFGGSQIQKTAPSIQAGLETALHKLTGERLRVAFAGRTDAGVHALGQVAACTTGSSLATGVFVRGLNAWLPPQIAVRRALVVDESFDPRRDASGRTYRYTVYNASVRSPLWRDRAWHVGEPLDVAAMQEAAALLEGEHDFAAFSRREPATTVRCVRRCRVEREGPLVTIEVEANAFLRQQVRRTAGALARAGRGELTPAAIRALLRKAVPASAGPVAPACGLCLLRVSYAGLDLGPETRYDDARAGASPSRRARASRR